MVALVGDQFWGAQRSVSLLFSSSDWGNHGRRFSGRATVTVYDLNRNMIWWCYWTRNWIDASVAVPDTSFSSSDVMRHPRKTRVVDFVQTGQRHMHPPIHCSRWILCHQDIGMFTLYTGFCLYLISFVLRPESSLIFCKLRFKVWRGKEITTSHVTRFFFSLISVWAGTYEWTCFHIMSIAGERPKGQSSDGEACLLVS